MGWLKKVWQALNGNKTKIGAVLVLVGKGLQAAGVAEGEAVEQVGTAIISLGLGHAATKTFDAPQQPAQPGVTPPPANGR